MTLREVAPVSLAIENEAWSAIGEAVEQVYVGPAEHVELLLIALLAGGHVLVEGLPGVAKTTLLRSFAAALGCSYRRIQFTPDLLPADITGSFVWARTAERFELREGPIFSQLVLADEINRAPARTQSALLEAMQERQVTIDGETRPLPTPFMVLASQNPLEQHGTYALPEAQLDRFLLRLQLGYPTREAERSMLQRFLTPPLWPAAATDVQTLLQLQSAVHAVHVDVSLLDYIVALTAHTRRHPRLRTGLSPRASLSMVQAARARALLYGRNFVVPEDIQQLSQAVWAHRLAFADDWQSRDADAQQVLAETLQQVAYR